MNLTELIHKAQQDDAFIVGYLIADTEGKRRPADTGSLVRMIENAFMSKGLIHMPKKVVVYDLFDQGQTAEIKLRVGERMDIPRSIIVLMRQNLLQGRLIKSAYKRYVAGESFHIGLTDPDGGKSFGVHRQREMIDIVKPLAAQDLRLSPVKQEQPCRGIGIILPVRGRQRTVI